MLDAGLTELYDEELDPKLLAIVREYYYETDDKGNKYKNVDVTEWTAENTKDLNVKRAHDAGNPRDVENTKGATISFEDNKPVIKINDIYQGDASKTFSVQYNYVGKSSTGECIFQSQRNKDQYYIAQQDSDGNIHLMQYAYHEGFDISDVTGI